MCYRPLATGDPAKLATYEEANPPSRTGSLPKYFIPGRSRDLVERIDVFSRNVVERPAELLFEAFFSEARIASVVGCSTPRTLVEDF